MEDAAMPETYSNGDRARQDNATELPWDSISFDWPIEILVAEAEVAVSRQPSALEWVVVRILQEFTDEAPTLAEAAEKLGMKDPVFLAETLKSLSASGLIEKQDAPGELDFANSRLTEAGRAFLEQGRLSSIPERHGLRLHLDLITDEHIRQPPRHLRQEPKNPILAAEVLPARRTTIGLDRARELAKDQEEPFLTPEAKVTAVTVQHEEGSIMWRPHDATVSIDGTGVIRCQLLRGTEQQQQWLAQLDLRHDTFAKLFLASASGRWASLPLPAISYDNWWSSIDRLVSPGRVVQEARDLIRSAQQEIIAHAYWLTIPEVRRELSLATARGIHDIIFAHQSQAAEVMGALSDAEQVIHGVPPEAHGQVALLSDGTRGIAINRVQLRSPSNRDLDVIVASSLRPLRVKQLRQELPAMAGSK
jgi:hypothetical protein